MRTFIILTQNLAFWKIWNTLFDDDDGKILVKKEGRRGGKLGFSPP